MKSNHADPKRYDRLANLIRDASMDLAIDILSNAVCHYGNGNQKRFEKRLLELKAMVLDELIEKEDIPLYVQALARKDEG